MFYFLSKMKICLAWLLMMLLSLFYLSISMMCLPYESKNRILSQTFNRKCKLYEAGKHRDRSNTRQGYRDRPNMKQRYRDRPNMKQRYRDRPSTR